MNAMIDDDPSTFDVEKLIIPSVSSACDLQVQASGTGEETYNLVKIEMSSVSCPHFEDRVKHCGLHQHRVSVYNFTLDQGPDNQGFIRRARNAMLSATNVLYTVCWCVLHQIHLVAKKAGGLMGCSPLSPSMLLVRGKGETEE
eukprot:2374099-Pyramimonas_sp.AAC.1